MLFHYLATSDSEFVQLVLPSHLSSSPSHPSPSHFPSGPLHRERRRLLRTSLAELNHLFNDSPGLLGPKVGHVTRHMRFIKKPIINWLFCFVSSYYTCTCIPPSLPHPPPPPPPGPHCYHSTHSGTRRSVVVVQTHDHECPEGQRSVEP